MKEMNTAFRSLSTVPSIKTSLPSLDNRLLAALPRDEYERFSSRLESVNLPKNRILYEVGDSVRHAYFFNGGMTAMLAINQDGQTIEIGMMSDEGFIGTPIIRRVGVTTCRVMTLLPCSAVRVPAEHLLAEFNRGGKLQQLLLRYSHVTETQMVLSTVCNLFHSVEMRVCRWLLVTHDCLKTESFDLTQENIAIMLGKHRNRISVAAGELQKRGLINYNRRGRITIIDRKALEAEACECYRLVKECVRDVFR